MGPQPLEPAGGHPTLVGFALHHEPRTITHLAAVETGTQAKPPDHVDIEVLRRAFLSHNPRSLILVHRRRRNSCDTSRTGTMARVYADVNQNMPRSYWDYDSVNISGSTCSSLFYTALFQTLTCERYRLGGPRELRGREKDWCVLASHLLSRVTLSSC